MRDPTYYDSERPPASRPWNLGLTSANAPDFPAVLQAYLDEAVGFLHKPGSHHCGRVRWMWPGIRYADAFFFPEERSASLRP
jgi:hypothetical protein